MEELLEVLVAIAKGAVGLEQARELKRSVQEIARAEALKIYRRELGRQKRRMKELHDELDEEDL